nr:ribonuclease H-like domain-containing protein [Tanacetum cinerariifolium]
MSLHGYFDGEYDDASDIDNVTLISKLDVSHPLHLHPNDYVVLTVVSVKLKGIENYQVWSCAMLLALEELPRCTCHTADDFKKHNKLMKLIQFLMGLDDTYMQIKSFILSRENLPDVKSAYAIISSEESHRIATGSESGTSQRLGYPADQVLDVLKTTLNFDNKNTELICGTCQRAKQTKEPFPLSDHVSTVLGELVHLDLWCPYKVTREKEPSPIRHGNSPSHSGSTSAFSNENDAGHSQDADVSAIENGIFAIDEENNSNSEGNDLHDQSHDNVTQDNNVYVDDIIITGNSLTEIEKVLDNPKGICLNQRKYCLELIDEFGLLAGKPSNLHMQPNISLTSEPSDTDHLLDNVTEYQKLNGKLIYLTTTRPDIAYNVSCLSQSMHNPLKSHMKTALKVIRHLKGPPGKGINVIKGSTSSIDLKTYPDAYWARCADTKRSITDYCVFMCGSLVSWKDWDMKASSNLSVLMAGGGSCNGENPEIQPPKFENFLSVDPTRPPDNQESDERTAVMGGFSSGRTNELSLSMGTGGGGGGDSSSDNKRQQMEVATIVDIGNAGGATTEAGFWVVQTQMDREIRGSFMG